MSFWRVMSVLGGVLAVVGLVLLVWIEVDLGAPFRDSNMYRLQAAVAPLMLVALGLLVTAAGAFMHGLTWSGVDDDT